MNAEINYYEILDKGGTRPQKPSLLFGLMEKLAERREIERKEYCDLAVDECPFAPPCNDGITDAVIEFAADDIICMTTTVADKHDLMADMNIYVAPSKEVLGNYATER